MICKAYTGSLQKDKKIQKTFKTGYQNTVKEGHQQVGKIGHYNHITKNRYSSKIDKKKKNLKGSAASDKYRSLTACDNNLMFFTCLGYG